MSQKDRYIDNDDFYMDDDYDEIDIMELLRKLLASWKQILKFCVVGAVVGVIAAYSIPKKYSSEAKLAPEASSRASGGGLSSLASLAGINIGGMETGDVMSPDIFPEIVQTTPFVIELFPLPVEFKHKKETLTLPLYEYIKEYKREPWWKKIPALPSMAIGMVRGIFSSGDEDSGSGFADINPIELTLEQAGIAAEIKKALNVSVDKKSGLVSVVATTQDPHVSATLCKTVIGNLQRYVTAYRTDKARQDLVYYQQLFDEAQESYFEAQQHYARYADSNQGVVLQRVRTEQERLQNDMNLKYELYNSCAQQLQVAKARLQQETPVCTILLPASVPLRPDSPTRKMILIAFAFLGGAVSVVWILWARDWIAELKKKEEEDSTSAE